MKQALSAEASIVSVNTASDLPLNVLRGTGTVEWDGKNPALMPIFAFISIDETFLPNFGIRLVKGRNFDGNASDSVHFMLNEAAIKAMNLKDPVGKRIKVEGSEGEIIGVVKDFNIASIHETIRPLILSCNVADNHIVLVKTTGDSAHTSLAITKALWKKYAADFPFNYKFLDEHYNDQYKWDQQTAYLFNFFAVIAIIISCLGLLGLVSFTAEQRTKEIGVRKVLGASIANITSMLSRDFLKLVFVAIIISVPVSWFFVQKWLSNYAFKVDVNWKLFAAGAMLTVVTALVTICVQSLKAALTNPVKSLKSE